MDTTADAARGPGPECEEQTGFISRRLCFLLRRMAALAGLSNAWGVPF